ncbi:hypothetical protein BJY00DRAFT_294918 [Aspergillus carlsbadensis]|nr:hypothetical protein BJY00DRAFT_294918 [Aspergillus carlsbadensis]
MAQKIDFNALRARTMGSGEDEEAVTVDTRGLISKVLARYSGKWTVLREMIQNAADANATKVTIRFETSPSTTVPLPSSADSTAMIKHTILNHTLKRLLISNNGLPFSEKDWARLKRIADGNPDETKIGAFGVGFYSVFDDCEDPFVSSGKDAMAFYWKGNALFTRRLQLDEKANPETTFVLDYRNDTSPVPSLMQLCQFLSSSLTFVQLECIELWLDDLNILRLLKKTAPSTALIIPRDIETKTQDGLMKITGITREVAQVDAVWMKVVDWNPNASTLLREGIRDTTVSLRSFLSKLTQSVTEKPADTEKKGDAGVSGDFAGTSTASVFLHINTASIQASIGQTLSSELERATRKPPPRKTSIAVLTPSYDTSRASEASGSQSEFLSSILPSSKGGRVFIGFPTHQTTGLNAHISAPSVIPTVERESIDLNTRHISKWNMEMLRAAGIVCRIAWSAEMASIKSRILAAKDPSKQSKIRKDDIVKVLPEAIHTANQFVFRESTPSSLLGQTMEDAFWTCNRNASIEVISTCGIVQNYQVRIAANDLTFIDSIPVFPEEFTEGSKEFVRKLTALGLVTEVTAADVKRELEAQTLRSSQIVDFLSWLGQRAISGQLDSYAVRSLLNVAVANADDENGNTAGLIVFSGITLFLNPQCIPVNLPLPPAVMPFKYTKRLQKKELEAFQWEELQVVPWLCWLVSNSGNRNVLPLTQDITKTASFAAQVLPVLSKQWDTFSPSAKQSVIDQLQPHAVIPTKVGMKRPEETYFPSVRLFDDLPVVHGLQGTKEKFLGALGVRKTVELGVIFERLLNNQNSVEEEGGGKPPRQAQWSHTDLIRYLASVSNDIPASDIKRLKDTSFCAAELGAASGDSKTSGRIRYTVQELFEPDESLKALGLPIIDWPGNYISNSPEGRFLMRLGIRSFPTAVEVIRIMARAAESDNWALHGKAISYYMTEYDKNGYNKFDCSSVTEPFLPLERSNTFLGESLNGKQATLFGLPAKGQYNLSVPSKCYTDGGASLFGFSILRGDLHRHASKLGVKQHPNMSECLDVLIRRPPSTEKDARVLFRYLAGRVSELNPRDIDRVGKTEIVPISTNDEATKDKAIRHAAPRMCYLGDGEDYKDLFDFVDFGQEANLFLMAVGSKREPTKVEIAQMVVREPARISSAFQSAERYLKLLRTLADDLAVLKKNKDLFSEMKKSVFLLASEDITPAVKQQQQQTEKTIMSKPEDSGDEEDGTEEHSIRKWTLAAAKDVVVADDFQSFVLFKEHVLAAPQEEVLEKFYVALGAVPISQLVDDRAHWGAVAAEQRPAAKLLKLINERSRLFLHDQTAETVRRNSRWLEKNLRVQIVHNITITRSLKGRRISYKQQRKAIIPDISKECVMRICPGPFDFYEISQVLSHIILWRPKLHYALTLEMLLKTDLLELRARGYNVERILRQKAQEARIQEDRRQQQLEEEHRRLQEKEAAVAQEQALMRTPEKNGQAQMPGVFPDSPLSRDQRPTSPSGSAQEKRRGLFSNFTKHFKDGNRSWNPFSETTATPDSPTNSPPRDSPKSPKDTKVNVSSPVQVQKKLLSAIQSSRPHGSSGVFSRPETKQVEEVKSYCDERPGYELEFVATLPSRVNILFSRAVPDRTAFLSNNSLGMNLFASILLDCAEVFSLKPDTLSIFYDPNSKSIGFNRAGSIFCNFYYFQQLHEKELLRNPKDQAEAITYWWVVLCHELAHNLVGDHGQVHSYYTEAFVKQYFPKVTAKIAAVAAKN